MERYYKKAPKLANDSTPHQTQRTDQSQSSSGLNHSHDQVVHGTQEPPSDPGLRPPISQYNPNECDRIRIFYLAKGPCQPLNYKFPQRDIGGKMRRFNKTWFNMYNSWVEYSIDKDAAFCLYCYLFRPENLGSGGRSKFLGEGFRFWKRKKAFEQHIGDSNSWHNYAQKRCFDLLNERQNIQIVLERQSAHSEVDYRVQLTASVDCARFLARQGLAFRGHDESESSNNKGIFLQLLRFLGDHNEQIDNVILENAHQNLKLTSPDIQKEIVNSAAEETAIEIIAELGDGLFSVLIDESRDISMKEQMVVVICFVNKKGCVVERFLGIVHVANTAALTLKLALENLFGKHNRTISRLRGQGYDGASNMRGEFNGLKALIMRENGSAYYVHCFAHQLQLSLVGVAKNHSRVALLFNLLSVIFNVAGASCKRRDSLREKRANEIAKAISIGEISAGKGLHQETNLSRAGDTRWSSHFKSLNSVITLFSATIDVIEEVEEDGGKTRTKRRCFWIIGLNAII